MTISETGPWTLGILIGLPAGIIAVIGLCWLAVLLWREPDQETDALLVSAIAVITLAAVFFRAWPPDSEYHQWRTVHGQVETVSSRLVSQDQGMSQRFIVVIDGQPFAVDDTRASLLKPGDVVDLRCKREWQYAGTSGWGCNWGNS